MNPLLYGLYQFLKVLVRIGLWIYYPKTTILNKERLNIKGPGIIATNHPNTLLDPFNAVSRIIQPVFFLANAGLFKTKFTNWLFTTLYCIPIERPEDTDGKPINNKVAFAKINQFLNEKGLIFIAPEGGSFEGRNLKKLKTGTARIALTAEQERDFRLGVQILPVALAYENPQQFRSRLVINVGAPIQISEFQQSYADDRFKTAKEITRLLTSTFKSLLVCPENKEEEILIGQIEQLQSNSLPMNPATTLQWRQQALAAVQQLRLEQEERYTVFAKNSIEYFEILDKNGIRDSSVAEASANSRPGYLKFLAPILAFPLFAYGYINHILPIGTPSFIWRATNIYSTYEATTKFMLGLVTIPLFYFLQYRLVLHFFGSSAGLIYLLAFLPAGLIAWQLRNTYSSLAADLRFSSFQKTAPALSECIIAKRKDLWKTIERLVPAK